MKKKREPSTRRGVASLTTVRMMIRRKVRPELKALRKRLRRLEQDVRRLKKAHRAPRKGSMRAMVIALTQAGKSTKQIGAAVAKAFPRSLFAKEVRDGIYRGVKFNQRHGRERGWLH